MKLRKVLSLVLTLGLLLTMLVSTAAFADTAKAKVEIWHTYTGAQAAFLENAAAEFNASQDKYEVQVITQAYSGFADAVYQAVANGTGPNLIFNYGSTAVDYIENDLAVNIQAYIDEDVANGDTTMQDIIDSLPEAMKTDVMGFADGGIYYLPGATTGPVFFYNKTIYDELNLQVPTTWEELAANCKAIYEAKGIAGFLADGLTDDIQALLMQTGAGYIDTATSTVQFGNEQGIAVFNYFAENMKAGYFALKPTNDYASDDFNSGLVASFSGSCVNEQYIGSDDFEIGIAPWLAQGDNNFYTAWNRGPVFLKQSDDQNRGAYEFIKFFLSADNNAEWVKANSAVAPYGTTEASEIYTAYLGEASDAMKAVAANMEYAGSFPNVHGASEVRNLLKEYLTYAATDQMTSEEAINGLVEACNAALK